MKSPPHFLLFSGLLFLSLQLTAPKSWVLQDLDSSLHQVTQHPTSLHPSISTQPTQPLLPIIPLGTGFIVDCRPVSEPGWSSSIQHFLSFSQKHTAKIFTPPFRFHNCLFLPSPVLAVSLLFSISFSPQSTERYRRVCVDFVALLTAIQKPLLACHRCDVVRQRSTRTNLSSMEPAFRESLFFLK